MTRDWTNIGDAVREYVEYIDENNTYGEEEWHRTRFQLNRIEIVPDGDSLRITAYDATNNLYKYSMYLNHGQFQLDG